MKAAMKAIPLSVALERARNVSLDSKAETRDARPVRSTSTIYTSPSPPATNADHIMTPITDALPGSGPSFVDGTPSSRSSQSGRKRDRQRSSSPPYAVPSLHALSPRPHKHEIRQVVVPPFIIKQYLAVESAVPLGNGDPEPGVLGESAEREAGYLLDDGSLLAKDQVRDHLGCSIQGGASSEEDIQWRTVPLRTFTMEDLRINGRSWTYQLPPPKIRSDDPTMDKTPGAIIGKPTSDLEEWERVQAVAAFSPIQSKTSPLPPASEHTTRDASTGRPTTLGSPFDSQRTKKRKSLHSPSSTTRRSPPPARQRESSPYVFVNDLPPWEWFHAPGSDGSSRGAGSQSQSARESLRHSWDDAGTRRKIDPMVPMTIVEESPHRREPSPDIGSASFLSEASMVEADDALPPSHLSGKAGEDGRIMHRMPMVLKDLDHSKFQHAGNERRKIVKVEPKEKPLEKGLRDGGVDKRVRELQLVPKKRDVRPIKDYLPLPMRVGGVVERANELEMGTEMMDDSVVEDVSFAESTHMDLGEGLTEGQPGPTAEDGAPRIFLEGVEVVCSSPKPVVEQPIPVLSRRQLARRRILADKARYGVMYDIIPEPHVVAVPLNIPEQYPPPPADFLCEPIPIFPSIRHPFHPNLQHYVDSSPYTRVKWLIPIQGPVNLSNLPEDEVLAVFRPSWGHLALSKSEYRDVRKQHRQTSSSTGSNGASTKPPARPLVWTRDSLAETWNMLLKMRKLGRLGPIALALASSEPDPFRPAARQSSYTLHNHKYTPFRSADRIHPETRPVRAETGDHIKLFCDLRSAMAVRQALKYLALGDDNTPLSRTTSGASITAIAAADAPSLPVHVRQALGPTLSSATSASSKPGTTHLPFRGAKLCLMGDRGEVLVVV